MVRLRPYTLLTNRFGLPLELRQAVTLSGDQPVTLQAWDWRTTFAFPAVQDPLKLQVKYGHPTYIEPVLANLFPLQFPSLCKIKEC